MFEPSPVVVLSLQAKAREDAILPPRQDANLVLGYQATGEVDSWVVAETVKVIVYGFLSVAINSG